MALMVMPAAAAHADTTDADFVSYLGAQGIHLGTASQTVNMAHAMCQDLNTDTPRGTRLTNCWEHSA